ncbi:MAG: leucyl aminopeptidase family protein [Spirochaetales bacterium]|nr:leucyl aminopeptidase family protein [Leptospiraceae bacterium]MCP5479838.1 leucyl aminopeptidase family protein [Spirochaetales bacterium]MCP5486228.1 leucyl aminopeptidase family protein [Spirochaetales bacterium]
MPTSSTELRIQNAAWTEIDIDLMIVPVFQRPAESDDTKPEPRWDALLEQGAGLFDSGESDLRGILANEGFRADYGKSLYLPARSKGPRRVHFLGLGVGRVLPPYRLRKAVRKALGSAPLSQIKSVGFACAPGMTESEESTALAVASALFDSTYRSREAREQPPELQQLVITGISGEVDSGFVRSIARASALAQDLANMPPNTKRTSTLATTARELAPLGVEVVIEEADWVEKNMPCFYLVARGSRESDPPRWIRARYKSPEASGGKRRRVCLVGKSVIFDTGGYQVKPGLSMNTMKGDMTGGATALAVLRCVAEMQLPNLDLEIFLAATPNMIDSSAMTPDSITNTTCGKRVEIRHTDAEGRLTLIDAVHIAEREHPELMYVVATLTGAASSAVGDRAALICRPSFAGLRDQLARAAAAAADPVQTLDLVEEDFEDIKSKLDGADIKNVGNGKNRGAQTAAAFVFSGAADSTAILHLDIAGGDMTEDDRATGIAVRSLVWHLRELSRQE